VPLDTDARVRPAHDDMDAINLVDRPGRKISLSCAVVSLDDPVEFATLNL
jgi:hypothetical protein